MDQVKYHKNLHPETWQNVSLFATHYYISEKFHQSNERHDDGVYIRVSSFVLDQTQCPEKVDHRQTRFLTTIWPYSWLFFFSQGSHFQIGF